MKQANGDLFNLPCDALCITTNGFVKTNGACVMGKGCAKQLTKHDPQAPFKLGNLIRNNGNIVQIIDNYGVPVLAFPVKPIEDTFDGSNVVNHMSHLYQIGSTVPGWACKADPEIIKYSALQLVKLADANGWTDVLLPRPGCGAGELNWNDIYPILNEILDERFTAITF